MAPPPSMAGAPPAQQQYQYQQPPPAPQSQQPYMYMMPHQSHPPPMWPPQQGSAGVPAQQPAAGQSGQPASADEVRTLWIGDLQYYMDENYLLSCFAQTGEVASVKVIRNKQKAKWRAMGLLSLSHVLLRESFTNIQWYSHAEWATGRTKGYGFVRFGDETEYNRAMSEMNGAFCSTRPMRIGPATNKKIGAAQQYPAAASSQGNQNDNDPNNTTIFVGNLDSDVTEDHLREVFSPYGQLVHVKIPQTSDVDLFSMLIEALRILNGTQLGGQSIRLSWGRSTSNKQAQPDPNQWNSGYYGYGQGYGYGYAAAHQDPNMYYGGYPSYGNYQQPQQQQQQQQIGYS
ncbi:Polyadenylate-binding protein RBP45A [Hibiscus syriacus]|uniref:Polyadenylate-binding protein RBP45A n=1 Tax=Hibiscus syriacus TaxID=106335 RepID=A0A6A3CHQ1_HIBSY|nr:Polyadenylate-binding protein RBP45A [Hibiscus syriacus]